MPDGRIICPLCSGFFDQLGSAKRHFQTVHARREMECEVCRQKFTRKDNLKVHLMKKHELEKDSAQMLADKAATK